MIYSFLVFILLAESTNGYIALKNSNIRPVDISSSRSSRLRKVSPLLLGATKYSRFIDHNYGSYSSSAGDSIGQSCASSSSNNVGSSSSGSSSNRKSFALNCVPSGSDEIQTAKENIGIKENVTDNIIDNPTTENVIDINEKIHFSPVEEPHLISSNPITTSLYSSLNPKVIEQKVKEEKEAALYSSLNPQGIELLRQ